MSSIQATPTQMFNSADNVLTAAKATDEAIKTVYAEMQAINWTGHSFNLLAQRLNNIIPAFNDLLRTAVNIYPVNLYRASNNLLVGDKRPGEQRVEPAGSYEDLTNVTESGTETIFIDPPVATKTKVTIDEAIGKAITQMDVIRSEVQALPYISENATQFKNKIVESCNSATEGLTAFRPDFNEDIEESIKHMLEADNASIGNSPV